jgi:large subunit ribosomal protein L17
MRHAKESRKFHRDAAQRQSLFRNLVTALLKHGRIETTLAKAKELRVWADKMITLGKRGDLHARRQAGAVIEEPKVLKSLFDEIAPVFKDRNGGYTRITHLGNRKGDCAPMAMIELVARPELKPLAKESAGKEKKAASAKGKAAPAKEKKAKPATKAKAAPAKEKKAATAKEKKAKPAPKAKAAKKPAKPKAK